MKGDEDSESVSLVGRDAPGSYTEDSRPTASLRETDYVDTDVPLQSQFHEDAIAQAGEGLFQWLVFLVCGLGLAADSIEVMVIAYVLPSAERELCMNDSRKGWLVVEESKHGKSGYKPVWSLYQPSIERTVVQE